MHLHFHEYLKLTLPQILKNEHGATHLSQAAQASPTQIPEPNVTVVARRQQRGLLRGISAAQAQALYRRRVRTPLERVHRRRDSCEKIDAVRGGARASHLGMSEDHDASLGYLAGSLGVTLCLRTRSSLAFADERWCSAWNDPVASS